MCGIIGVVSGQQVHQKLLDGLLSLEYRGYDSVGMCTIDKNSLILKKGIGKVQEVHDKHDFSRNGGTIGLAHCRWGTHGGITDENAHPHVNEDKTIALVHNGIIENYAELKEFLAQRGHVFSSETDSEVIVHLIEEFYKKVPLEEATRLALHRLEGSYALGILSLREPGKLVAARNESPLIIGVGKGEHFLASDVPAVLKHTNKVIYLEDKEIAVLEKGSCTIIDYDGKAKEKQAHTIDWGVEAAEKAGYGHFMLKEIHEQPQAIAETIQERLHGNDVVFEDEINLSADEMRGVKRIILLGCGTSWHACLAGEFMLEELAKIPTEVEYASEFRYRNPLIGEHTLAIAISQSGETADTVAALKEAKEKGAKTLAICNVKGSSITRIADGTIYTRAGPEIGVASTKAFTTQLAVLYLLTIALAKERKALTGKQIGSMVQGIRRIPLQLQSVLAEDGEIRNCAALYHKKTNSLYLGRGVNFPIALEGALKLKEVSYIHAEGYPAAEMKHGPIALIDKEMPVVIIAPQDVYTYRKILGNIEEVKARGGIIIAIATEGDREIPKKADHTIFIPKTLYTLSSILAAIPLQLLAYHTALMLGRDVDKPRNLAKSVTVE
ncbi:glutamine--fructose-6-phosphate transaminase (isomerizing) [Candidatus Woesearchaeota archaeon]|nr:glutamine--fructose-6-phosphate transaminase (isomerizing) [Candidatus Woesearchaeota archaeon]